VRNDLLIQAAALGNIGVICSAKGDLDEALKYLESALAVLDRFGLSYGREQIETGLHVVRCQLKKKGRE
jgi:tetratricopeptide (TPR) repeat protein